MQFLKIEATTHGCVGRAHNLLDTYLLIKYLPTYKPKPHGI
jgi:hypothetical protein